MRALPLALLLAACADAPDDAVDTDGVDSDPADALDVAACLRDPACPRVLVAAHRGFHRDVPENSLAAVRATATLGAHLAELDVRDTKDGKLVLMHDDTVDRTTDGTGSVGDLTLAELGALTLDGGVGDEGARVPTFDEALALAVELGVGIYVDTKTDRVDLVVEAIVAAGAEDLALVRKDFATLGPALDAGLLVLAPAGDEDELATFASSMPADGWVEIAVATPSPDLGAAIAAAGLRAQQDVFLGDAGFAVDGSTTGWKPYLDAGVRMPQSEWPEGVLAGLADGTLPDGAE